MAYRLQTAIAAPDAETVNAGSSDVVAPTELIQTGR